LLYDYVRNLTKHSSHAKMLLVTAWWAGTRLPLGYITEGCTTSLEHNLFWSLLIIKTGNMNFLIKRE